MKKAKPIKPISPQEIVKPIPEQFNLVIESFNELIGENFNGVSSKFLANDVVNLIIEKTSCERNEVYKNGYLDIESIYEPHGWIVEYDQPSIGDSFPAYYKFTRKSLLE